MSELELIDKRLSRIEEMLERLMVQQPVPAEVVPLSNQAAKLIAMARTNPRAAKEAALAHAKASRGSKAVHHA